MSPMMILPCTFFVNRIKHLPFSAHLFLILTAYDSLFLTAWPIDLTRDEHEMVSGAHALLLPLESLLALTAEWAGSIYLNASRQFLYSICFLRCHLLHKVTFIYRVVLVSLSSRPVTF